MYLNKMSLDAEMPAVKQSENATTNPFNNLTQQDIAKYRPLREIEQLAHSTDSNYSFYQNLLDEAKAVHPLLTHVVQGNPDELASLVKQQPALLFQKGQVSLNKEYEMTLMSHDTIVKPNRIYFKTRCDGSLQYTVLLAPQEAPITAVIELEELTKIGIEAFSTALCKKDIESQIQPKLEGILELTTLRGHTPPEITYYDVSPYQLLTFLCDEDMKESIMKLVMPLTQAIQCIHQAQYAEIDSGGADLVKMDRDPRLLPFKEVTRFVANYNIDKEPTEIIFPLLENTDGIVYYNDTSTNTEQLFYANQETKTFELIEPLTANSNQELQSLQRLYSSFRDMEQNSARRSSNDEHLVIANTMQHHLQRKGIQYEQYGTRYCDNRADFNQHFNARRKCIRLYEESKIDEGDIAWCQLVGQEERKVMWVLERLCEE